MNLRVASDVSTPSLRVAASPQKFICPIYYQICNLSSIARSRSQADPQFRTNRLYTRLTATEVRRQLIAHKGYTDHQLPTAETIGCKLNALGYYPKKVAKSQPQKKSPKLMPSSSR